MAENVAKQVVLFQGVLNYLKDLSVDRVQQGVIRDIQDSLKTVVSLTVPVLVEPYFQKLGNMDLNKMIIQFWELITKLRPMCMISAAV